MAGVAIENCSRLKSVHTMRESEGILRRQPDAITVTTMEQTEAVATYKLLSCTRLPLKRLALPPSIVKPRGQHSHLHRCGHCLGKLQVRISTGHDVTLNFSAYRGVLLQAALLSCKPNTSFETMLRTHVLAACYINALSLGPLHCALSRGILMYFELHVLKQPRNSSQMSMYVPHPDSTLGCASVSAIHSDYLKPRQMKW